MQRIIFIFRNKYLPCDTETHMEHVLQVLVLYDTHLLINVYHKIFFFWNTWIRVSIWVNYNLHRCMFNVHQNVSTNQKNNK